MDAKSGDKDKKYEIITAAAAAAGTVLTAALISPADIVLANQSDFTVNAADIIGAMAVCAVICALAVFGLLMLLRLINPKAMRIAADVLLGISLASYVQVLFFNGLINDQNGVEINGLSRTLVTVNTVVWIELLLIPPAAGLYFATNPGKKLFGSETVSRRAVPYIFALLLIMQGAGAAASAAADPPKEHRRDYSETYVFDIGSLGHMSPDGNVLVLLLDMLDTYWMDDMLKYYPELYDELDGFTYYRNNIPAYPTTFPSVASMLTNSKYNDTNRYSWLNSAWDSRLAMDELREAGCRVNLILDGLNDINDPYLAALHADNAFIPENVSYRLRYDRIVTGMLRMSASRYAPYLLKNMIWGELAADVSNDFIEYEYSDGNLYMPGAVGSETDCMIDAYFRENPITADSDKRTFTFVHLNGPHDVSEDVARIWDGTHPDIGELHSDERWSADCMRTCRGCFAMVKSCMDQLKDAGLYDCTSVVLLADHGCIHREIYKLSTISCEDMAGLLIKPAGEPSHSLYIDDDTEMSNDMLMASALEWMGLPHAEYGLSYNDAVSGAEVTRYFDTTGPLLSQKGIKKTYLYKVTGNARDFSNWEIVPREQKDAVDSELASYLMSNDYN